MLHGGEIYNNREVRYDFSVNINPLGIPENVLRSLRGNLTLLTQYPDMECRELRRALEKFTGLPMRQILCGNGASELIEAAVRALDLHSILLTAPSFSGYRHAAQAGGAKILYHLLKREEEFALTDRYFEDLAKGPDLAILCSPANPIGNRIPPGLLCKIAETCERQNTWLLIDECFLGFMPDEKQSTMRRLLVPDLYSQKTSVATMKKPADTVMKKLLVLDAFTKRFAIPGVRLGYLMAAEPAILEKIHAQQPEWSVSLPAQIAGLAALEKENEEYLETARAIIFSERKRMAAVLESMGCRVFPGEANYIFFSCEKELYEPLLEKGILIRRCDNYEGLRKGDYRTAVLCPEENNVLLRAIEEIVHL